MQKPRVGIDMHGVLDSKSEEFFQSMIEEYKDSEIFVISGARKERVERELKRLFPNTNMDNISILSVLDFLDGKVHISFKDYKGKMREVIEDDDMWDAMKSVLCKKHNISVLIDDTLAYGDYFGKTHPTTFVYFDKEERNEQ